MKKLIKTLSLFIALSILPLAMMAQSPPHPNGGVEPGSGNVPVGGGAPIGGGMVILFVLGSAWAAKKTYSFKKD